MFICWTKPSGRIKKIRKANQLSKTHFDFSFLLPLSFFPFLYLGYIWGVMQDKLQIRMNSIISPCYSSFSFWNISNKWTNMENNVTVIKDPSSAPMNINFSPYLLRGFCFLRKQNAMIPVEVTFLNITLPPFSTSSSHPVWCLPAGFSFY